MSGKWLLFEVYSSPSTYYPGTTEKEKSGRATTPAAIFSATTPLGQIAAAQAQQRVTSHSTKKEGPLHTASKRRTLEERPATELKEELF